MVLITVLKSEIVAHPAEIAGQKNTIHELRESNTVSSHRSVTRLVLH